MIALPPLPTLFSRNTKGEIEQWDIHVADNGTFSTIRVTYGKFLGKKITKLTDITQGKNIGKLNATTHYEQAILEACSKHEKKRTDGYKSLDDVGISIEDKEAILTVYLFEDIRSENFHFILNHAFPKYNTTNTGQVMPMKAQQLFNKHNEPTMKLPAIIQPKLNGVRAFLKMENRKVVITSKRGTYYEAVAHIINAIPNSTFKTDIGAWTGKSTQLIDVVFDGELYKHGLPLQDIVSACRVADLLTNQIEFHVYDLAIPDVSQDVRLKIASHIIRNLPIDSPVKFVQTKGISTWESAKRIYEEKVQIGYEGVMLRQTNALYAFGQRSSCIKKWKSWHEAEFLIVDVIDTDTAPELGMFVCRNDKTHDTFSVVPLGSHELRKEYLINKSAYIGKLLTVRYSERTSPPTELPRHATGIIIRDYE